MLLLSLLLLPLRVLLFWFWIRLPRLCIVLELWPSIITAWLAAQQHLQHSRRNYIGPSPLVWDDLWRGRMQWMNNSPLC